MGSASDGKADQDHDQDRVERKSRQTGGDAPAAGSLEEREAVARDEDDEFDDGESDDGDED
jgi:hypothetical protein